MKTKSSQHLVHALTVIREATIQLESEGVPSAEIKVALSSVGLQLALLGYVNAKGYQLFVGEWL